MMRNKIVKQGKIVIDDITSADMIHDAKDSQKFGLDTKMNLNRAMILSLHLKSS